MATDSSPRPRDLSDSFWAPAAIESFIGEWSIQGRQLDESNELAQIYGLLCQCIMAQNAEESGVKDLKGEGAVTTANEGIGVIKPPPPIRKVLETTAAYVAQHGKSFEQRILSDPKLRAKSLFLEEDNPYHAYYLERVEELSMKFHNEQKASFQASDSVVPVPTEQSSSVDEKRNDTDRHAGDASQAQDGKPETITRQAVSSSFAGAVSKVKALVAPPDFRFLLESHPEVAMEGGGSVRSATFPSSSALLPVDLEIIKLTAQFAVIVGNRFLEDITSRERHNPQFAFLKHSSDLYKYFSSLVTSYRKIFDDGTREQVIGELDKILSNRLVVLDGAVHRLEWAKKLLSEKAASAQEEFITAEIDWSDFLVVEKIDFPEAMGEENVLPSVSFVRQEQGTQQATVDRGVDDMDMDEDDNDQDTRRAAQGALNVRTDYVAKGVTAKIATPMVTLDDGREIPAEEVNAHLKIELQDPKHKINRERFEKKHEGTNLEKQDEMYKNLMRLKENRPDLFGEDATEEPAKKKAKG